MILTYKLDKDLVGRAATQLCWQLKEVKSSVSIMTERIVNAKSLVGILSAQLKAGTYIIIAFDYDFETETIKRLFNEVGSESNELLEQQP